MKRIGGLLLVLILISGVLLVGYNSKSLTKNNVQVITYNDLVTAINNKKYKIDEIPQSQDDLKDSFFSVPGKCIDVNGERLAIYEFTSSDTAKSQSQIISIDGNTVGNCMIEWAGIPHFYQKGNLIIEYTGSNKKLLNDLSDIVGKPITNT